MSDLDLCGTALGPLIKAQLQAMRQAEAEAKLADMALGYLRIDRPELIRKWKSKIKKEMDL